MIIKLTGISIKLLATITLAFTLFPSCKKYGGTGDQELSDADSLKYLVYQIMEKTIIDDGRDKTTTMPLYYWYNKVPALNPLGPEFPTAKELLGKMQSYTTDNTGGVMDRYSFLDDGTIVGEIQGVAGDMGMEVGYVRFSQSSILPVVIFTDKNSPSGQAGIDRGWIITSVNNQSVNYDNANGPNVTRLVNAVYYDDQATFKFQKPDNSSVSLTIAKSEYLLNPILFDTVYNISGKNTGYFVFNTFSAIKDDNNQATLTKNEIDRVINSFISQHVSSLIVDLRYNGGGDVSTCEYLADRIAPASANGKKMYQKNYNDILGPQLDRQGMNPEILFNAAGNLNLENVFFIGTDNTASASELLYNSLRPYMNVKLVGSTTYGKPVGSLVWPITIFKDGIETFLAYLIPIAFESVNADGVGGYYHGIEPDVTANDYIDIPWGNEDDENLSKIFTYISTGDFGRMASTASPPENRATKIKIPGRMPTLRYNGMIQRADFRKIY